MSTQRDKAEALRALHKPGEPLVLVNVWDAVTARIVAGTPGCAAIATASHSIANAHGYPDGEAIPRDEMIAAVGLIARSVELPVTADLERGYADAGETVALAIEAGAVGCNLEDSDADGSLRPTEEHAARVAAARANGDELGVPLVINARTDLWFKGDVPPDERVAATIERGEAYMEAGADVIFVPGLRDLEVLSQLSARLPISVIGGAGGPTLAQFASAGVSRISYGPGPYGVAMAAVARAAETLLAGGAPPEDLGFRP